MNNTAKATEIMLRWPITSVAKPALMRKPKINSASAATFSRKSGRPKNTMTETSTSDASPAKVAPETTAWNSSAFMAASPVRRSLTWPPWENRGSPTSRAASL